ncbi:MAG: hypothetical protein ACQEWW_00010 [Bacillota bacterium]
MIQIENLEKRTVRKVMKRIIPYTFLLYIIAILDRVNLSYAALEMKKDLGLTAGVYGLISGIFEALYAQLSSEENR